MNIEQLKSSYIKRDSNGFYYWFLEVGIRSTSGIKRFYFQIGFFADETAKFIASSIIEDSQIRDDVWKLLLNSGYISETVDFEIVDASPRLRCDIARYSDIYILYGLQGYCETKLYRFLRFQRESIVQTPSKPVAGNTARIAESSENNTKLLERVADGIDKITAVLIPAVSSESAPAVPVADVVTAPADSKRGKTKIDSHLKVRIGEYIQNNITEKDKLSYRAIAREFNLGIGTISSNEKLKKCINDMINSESHSIDNNPNFDNDPYSNWKKN